MTTLEAFQLLSSAATAVGVGITAYQIYVSRALCVTQFEDGFAKEYREITAKIPTRALLGAALNDDEKKEHFDDLFRYFDLCNEQIFLRQKNRIRPETWKFWSDGMKSNFKKPAFRWAWDEMESELNKTGATDYSEFRKLVAFDFDADPRDWKRG
jgi:hypothetical protein